MNPIFLFQAVINTFLQPKRTCPKCKRAQVVPVSKRRKSVPCKFCGADVPPGK